MNPRKDYQAALALRLEGKSYGEITAIFGIPKSTLSVWFSKLKVSKKAQKILESKRKNGYFKLVEFNKIRTLNIKEENERIRSDYESKVNSLNNRELMIIGAALYWGEGYKNFNNVKRKGSYPYICFGNSDPQMVKIFISFLEIILKIDRGQIKCQIMIYPSINPFEALKYWQDITKIPVENFRTQLTISRASQGKRPWNLLPYGTLQLRVNKRQNFFKIKGLIDGLIRSSKINGSPR